MSILNRILSVYPDEGFVKVEGFDDALVGLSTDGRLVYSLDKIIEKLKEKMSEDEAINFFYFNIQSPNEGGKSPVFIKLIN